MEPFLIHYSKEKWFYSNGSEAVTADGCKVRVIIHDILEHVSSIVQVTLESTAY